MSTPCTRGDRVDTVKLDEDQETDHIVKKKGNNQRGTGGEGPEENKLECEEC